MSLRDLIGKELDAVYDRSKTIVDALSAIMKLIKEPEKQEECGPPDGKMLAVRIEGDFIMHGENVLGYVAHLKDHVVRRDQLERSFHEQGSWGLPQSLHCNTCSNVLGVFEPKRDKAFLKKSPDGNAEICCANCLPPKDKKVPFWKKKSFGSSQESKTLTTTDGIGIFSDSCQVCKDHGPGHCIHSEDKKGCDRLKRYIDSISAHADCLHRDLDILGENVYTKAEVDERLSEMFLILHDLCCWTTSAGTHQSFVKRSQAFRKKYGL